MELISTELFADTKQEIRIFGTSEKPFFVAKDVMIILGMKNDSNNLKCVPEKYRVRIPLVTSGGKQMMTLINESGLYKLIMRSNKPQAEKFQEWICEDVLPAIRKTGAYKAPEIVDKSFDYYLEIIENLEKMELPENVKQFLLDELDNDVNNGQSSFTETMIKITKLKSKKLSEKLTKSLFNKLITEMRPTITDTSNVIEIYEDYEERFKDTLKDSFWSR